MDYAKLRFWFDVAQLLGTVALGVYVFFSNRHRVTSDRIKKTDKKIDDLRAEISNRCTDEGTRLTKVETSMESAPSRKDLEKLHTRLDVFNKDVGRLEGMMKGLDRNVTLLNQHHINGGK